jgi:hypothetical protein
MRFLSIRRRGWILLGALALLVLLIAYFIGRRSPKAESSRPQAFESQSFEGADKLPSNDSNPVPVAATVAETHVKDSLCGVSGKDQVRNDGETIEQHVARLTADAIIRWKAALLASGDPRQQAVGLALENVQPVYDSSTYVAPDTSSNNNLVLLAIGSNDPSIYALALQQCGAWNWDMTAGPCQGLSLEHFAQIDPNNATPWLWIAARANRNGNYAQANDALSRAASASNFQSYLSVMSAVALDALPADFTPLEKATAGADLVSISLIGSSPGLVNLCSPEALQVPQRNDQCSNLANLLSTQGTTSIDVAMAAILAKRLGWPEDKRTALRNEANSYVHVIATYPWGKSGADQSFQCENLGRYDYFIDQLASHGGSERAAMKATIEALQTPDISDGQKQ